MNPDLTDIKQQLAELQKNDLEIKAMLNQLLHPAQSMDARAKAKTILDALNTGDRKHYLDVRKQINGV